MSRRACPDHPDAPLDEEGDYLPVCLAEPPHVVERWDVRDASGQVVGWGSLEQSALLRGESEERIERLALPKRRRRRRRTEARHAGVLGQSC